MTSPILRGLSRRKHCQNLDTTALRVGKQARQKTLQNHRYADLWAKRPKELVSGRHIKDNKNGKQVNFSFSKIWWASKVYLLAIRNDCVARSYRFSVPLTCTRATIRQKVYCKGLGSLLSYPLLVATLYFNPAEGPQTASRSAECRPAELPYVLALDL